ncbi:MAG: HDOD domain-containing protein [Desulfuromonadaceae bacterium]|nr:HDOD domain-containing protein [Desulfuromonadaceae bacterium]
MRDIFVGRQPIFDRTIQVYGYELLYRDSYVDRANITDADQASCDVVANALLEIGLENIVGPHKAFCNFSRGFLLRNSDFSFAAEKLVIEILEDIVPDAKVVQAIQKFSAAGHLIALDDFVYREDLRPLVEQADLIKVEVMGLAAEQIQHQLKTLKAIKPTLKFLAEKVESNDVFQVCRDLGFDYFQGFFFSKPKIVIGKKLPPARVALLNLVAELQQPDVSLERVEKIIEADVYLSVKLLRQINSSYYSLVHPVTSIHQAIVRFGLQHIRTWTCVLLLGSVSEKTEELITMALIRAKMCELLTEPSRSGHAGMHFTVGLFSLLDSLLDAPMEHILSSLPLSDEIKSALLSHEGPVGKTLETVQAYEQNRLEDLTADAENLDRLRDAYWQAVRWTDQVRNNLS